jgi:hypothetical protein
VHVQVCSSDALKRSVLRFGDTVSYASPATVPNRLCRLRLHHSWCRLCGLRSGQQVSIPSSLCAHQQWKRGRLWCVSASNSLEPLGSLMIYQDASQKVTKTLAGKLEVTLLSVMQ